VSAVAGADEDAEPTYSAGAGDVSLLTEDFDAWASVDQSAVAAPKMRVFGDAENGGGNPVATATLVSPGRGGAGKCLRLTYPQAQSAVDSRHFLQTVGISVSTAFTSYQTIWIRPSTNACSLGSVKGTTPKFIQHYHTAQGAAQRVQISSFKFASGSPSLGGLPAREYFHVNSQANSLALQRGDPHWLTSGGLADLADNDWHRFTTGVKANTSQGSRDGMAKLWVDGTLVVDLSARGVLLGRTDNTELDQLVWDRGIGDIHYGDVLFAAAAQATATFTFDYDDFQRWRKVSG
jgi:hypothetical protein